MNGAITQDHLLALRSSHHELRAEARELMARLRASIFEMRSHRIRLRGSGHDPAGNGLVSLHARWSGPVPQAVSLQVDHGLTPREIEVAMLLSKGCSNRTIANRLGVSPHTARHHTQQVLAKLGVHSRAEAGARLRP
ncbi:MAG: helix-turn-helix transcriptional regulator [Gemmatimonadales bacterium]